MYRRIVALNNKGVESLRRHRFYHGILSFRHAINCLKAYHHDRDGSLDSESLDEIHEFNGRAKSAFQCRIDSMDLTKLLAVSPHNMFEIYPCAFSLPKQMIGDSVDISLILFFNLALAHHFLGVENTHQGRANLKESLRFYKITMNIFKAQSEISQGALPLVLGCLNNQGHIFSHSFCQEEAELCSRAIHILLETPSVVSLTDADCSVFFGGLRFDSAQSSCHTTAPAA